MKVLVTGVNGQLGHDIIVRATDNNIDAIGIDRNVLDLTDKEAVESYFIKNNDFDAIIHCAAYTAVDNAEDDVAAAENVNVKATEYLVNASKQMNAKFMYISTDYVYSGADEGIYVESSATAPTSVYGKTKLAGEQVALSLDKSYVVRISWVFGLNGNNFIKTMLRLSETHEVLNVVDDQIGSPTYTYDVAGLLLEMIQSDKYGIYQATNEGFCSWYEFAVKIFELAKRDVKVNPVDSSQFLTKAVRPKNSKMSKDKLEQAGFTRLRSWEDATADFLEKYLSENEEK